MEASIDAHEVLDVCLAGIMEAQLNDTDHLGYSMWVRVITVSPGMVGVVHNSERDPSPEGEGSIAVAFAKN